MSICFSSTTSSCNFTYINSHSHAGEVIQTSRIIMERSATRSMIRHDSTGGERRGGELKVVGGVACVIMCLVIKLHVTRP